MTIALRSLFTPSTPPASRRSSNVTTKSLPLQRSEEVLSVSISAGKLKQCAWKMLDDCIVLVHIAETKQRVQNGIPFVSSTQLPYAGMMEPEDLYTAFIDRIDQIFDSSADQHEALTSIATLVLKAETLYSLMHAIDGIVHMLRPMTQLVLANHDTLIDNAFFSKTQAESHVVLKWCPKLSFHFMDAVSSMLHKLRRETRRCSAAEFLAVYLAYVNLSTQCTYRIPSVSLQPRFLGTPGFRTHAQTYMSLTDPGDGHRFGTTKHADWMRGAIVHVEHLERPGNLPRSDCESYRIPSILDFALVRLHAGPAAPTTYFVGRMLKDAGTFDQDFIKVVNTAAFALGAAECKVAMDGLTTSQCIAYMRALSAAIMRNRHRQYLSCAWNINTTLIDDAPPFPPVSRRMITERMDIGRRAIEIAILGGFDKITWDGASDRYPSKCIIDQLGFRCALQLVHLAHEAGFVTYFSAGFKFDQISEAVLTGIDGIGIGGAQVLRFMDPATGMHGPYLEENIDEILARRDVAERTVRGKGVTLLSRLDRMYHEGSITATEDSRRRKLYLALADAKEQVIKRMLKKCATVMDLPQDGETPFTGRAKRLTSSVKPLLKKYAVNSQEWADFVGRIKKLIAWDDEQEIYEEYCSPPWANWRKAYRADHPCISDHYQIGKVIPNLN
ncbi:hypothetical protein HKX48_006435 [Thoreauomyces humboldtii]|nr:hypothetical protein HKX48_006435 [Thoreauomyces humboldtii]